MAELRCWHCGHGMIWGGDFDFDDYGMDGYGIVSNFSCSNCECYAEFYMPCTDDIEEEDIEGEGDE